MASSISLLLLLTLLSSLHTDARDSQFFNKIPSTTNTVVVPNNNAVVPDNNSKETQVKQQQQQQQQQEPNFLPENENSYGLYGHESGQEPPSTAATTTTTPSATTPYNTEFKQPEHKYLPKNYNPVAYVTQPEDTNDGSTAFTEQRSFSNNPTNYYTGEKNTEERSFSNNPTSYYTGEKNTEERSFSNNPTSYYTGEKNTEERSFSNNPTNYYAGEKNYYNNQEEGQNQFRNYPAAATKDNGNYYYNGAGSSFSTQPTNSRYRASATFSNGGATSFQPQGMSDTRLVENGKYFYDVNAKKYSSNHPYESLRGARNEFNNRNLYGNAENNGYEFNGENSMGGYYRNQNQNQEEFQEEENLP